MFLLLQAICARISSDEVGGGKFSLFVGGTEVGRPHGDGAR